MIQIERVLGATKEYQDRFLDLLQSRLPSRSLDNKGERCEGTANWIFEKPEFETWKETDQPRILTLLGPPGQGKSVLAKHVSKTLSHQHIGSLVVEIYCQDSITAITIACVMLYELLMAQRRLFKHVYRIIKDSMKETNLMNFLDSGNF